MKPSRWLLVFRIAILIAASTASLFCLEALNIPPSLLTYYERDGSASEGGMSEWEGRGKQFVAFFTVNWREMLHSWESKPPTPQQAALVRSAAESLPGREYMEFLNLFLDHYEKGKINKNVTGSAMSGLGDKMGFIATNFQDPDVRKLVNRYRGLMSTDPDEVHWCDSILKGDLRYQHQMFRGKSHPAPELLSETQSSTQKITKGPKADTQTGANADVNETKPRPSSQSEEPTSSTPWSIIVVLIVAATGLLWLLLKRRAK